MTAQRKRGASARTRSATAHGLQGRSASARTRGDAATGPQAGSAQAGKPGSGGLVALRVDPAVRGEMPDAMKRRLKRACHRMLRALGLWEVELSVLLSTDERLAQLNHAWRKKRGPTDVLSFPQVTDPEVLQSYRLPLVGRAASGPERPLGDLVISLHRVKQRSPTPQAMEADLMALLAHGVLHLLGHDHPTAPSRRAMLTLETDLIAIARTRGPVKPMAAPPDPVITP